MEAAILRTTPLLGDEKFPLAFWGVLSYDMEHKEKEDAPMYAYAVAYYYYALYNVCRA